MLFLNNLTTPSAKIFSVVSTKYAMFVILLHTTSILLYPYANSSLVMKSTVI